MTLLDDYRKAIHGPSWSDIVGSVVGAAIGWAARGFLGGIGALLAARCLGVIP